jgi:hypothetical protein
MEPSHASCNCTIGTSVTVVPISRDHALLRARGDESVAGTATLLSGWRDGVIETQSCGHARMWFTL